MIRISRMGEVRDLVVIIPTGNPISQGAHHALDPY